MDQIIRCRICLKSLQEETPKERYNRRCNSCQPPTETHEDVLWYQVIDDMKKRDEFGRRKYGKPLLINDGRDTLQDAYEEALDLAVYLKKAIMERQHAARADNTTSQRQDIHQGGV